MKYPNKDILPRYLQVIYRSLSEFLLVVLQTVALHDDRKESVHGKP